MGRCQQEVLAGCRLPDPPGIPAQLLLEPPWPEDPEPDLAASQPNGLTNRRMRTRMSGGVRGGGRTRPYSIFIYGRIRQRCAATCAALHSAQHGSADGRPPGASSSRSQIAIPTAWGRGMADLGSTVRLRPLRPPLAVAIVTHLVTQSFVRADGLLAWHARSTYYDTSRPLLARR